jgi:hypothetical protein
MHSGHGAHEEMDRRAIACFDQALGDIGLARQSRLARVLHDYFAWATRTTMARYHESADDVPEGLRSRTGHGTALWAKPVMTRAEPVVWRARLLTIRS